MTNAARERQAHERRERIVELDERAAIGVLELLEPDAVLLAPIAVCAELRPRLGRQRAERVVGEGRRIVGVVGRWERHAMPSLASLVRL